MLNNETYKEDNKLVISLKEASKLCGLPESTLRELMIRGLIDIGLTVPPKNKGGNRKYYVYKYKLLRALGYMEEILNDEENKTLREKE